jgi:hypothetical protein
VREFRKEVVGSLRDKQREILGRLATARRARVVERTVDSGPWPCEFAGASAVRLALPGKTPGIEPPDIVQPAVQKRPGVVVAEADLKPAQVQDLAEQVGELACDGTSESGGASAATAPAAAGRKTTGSRASPRSASQRANWMAANTSNCCDHRVHTREGSL